MNQILKYVGYRKPTLAMYVLHNLHEQLSQYHDFIFSLNINRDGALLGLSSIMEVYGKLLSLDPFLLSFF